MCNLTLYYSSVATEERGRGREGRGREGGLLRLETDDGVHESRKVIGDGRKQAERTNNNFENIALLIVLRPRARSPFHFAILILLLLLNEKVQFSSDEWAKEKSGGRRDFSHTRPRAILRSP